MVEFCSKKLTLQPHEVNLWCASLALTAGQIDALKIVLHPDEIQRADRFRFPIHRQRFIAARGILRYILSYYLDSEPQDIEFAYHHRGKPYLINTDVQFNLSHSHDMAVYAVTLHHAIGIDIERISDKFEEAVAKRYFSSEEYKQLMALPIERRLSAFYLIWSRKEAIIKAIGEGLSFPLSSFSVSIDEMKEDLTVDFNGKSQWHLEGFLINPEYQSAFATQQQVEKIVYWQWTPAGLVQLS